MIVDMTRPFNCPVVNVLMIKPAFIADIFFYFAVLIFSCGYTKYVIAFRPENHLATAFIALPVRIQWIGEPYATLESKSTVSQRPDRANINHISRVLIIYGFLNVCADLRCITSIKHSVNSVVRELISDKSTSIT